MQTTAWPFIELDDRGRPLIQGTRYKVLLLVEEHRLYDWDAEQLRRQHPDLSLPQLHAALGFQRAINWIVTLMIGRFRTTSRLLVVMKKKNGEEKKLDKHCLKGN